MSELVAKMALRLLQVSLADNIRLESHARVAFDAALTLEKAIYLNSEQQSRDSLVSCTRKHPKGRALNEAQAFWLH